MVFKADQRGYKLKIIRGICSGLRTVLPCLLPPTGPVYSACSVRAPRHRPSSSFSFLPVRLEKSHSSFAFAFVQWWAIFISWWLLSSSKLTCKENRKEGDVGRRGSVQISVRGLRLPRKVSILHCALPSTCSSTDLESTLMRKAVGKQLKCSRRWAYEQGEIWLFQ